jgi:hypothetical protein
VYNGVVAVGFPQHSDRLSSRTGRRGASQANHQRIHHVHAYRTPASDSLEDILLARFARCLRVAKAKQQRASGQTAQHAYEQAHTGLFPIACCRTLSSLCKASGYRLTRTATTTTRQANETYHYASTLGHGKCVQGQVCRHKFRHLRSRVHLQRAFASLRRRREQSTRRALSRGGPLRTQAHTSAHTQARFPTRKRRVR